MTEYVDWIYIDSLNTKNGSNKGVISDDRQEIRTAGEQVEVFREIISSSVSWHLKYSALCI